MGTDPKVRSQLYGLEDLQSKDEVSSSDLVEQLAPRAALLIEGSAFQKISRVDATKLRSADAVKHFIEALGGSWGQDRTDVEETHDLFERALYMVNQKQDETNDSYLARHDVAFEDLMSKQVSLTDIRAYVLVRQSALGPEDRKKIILDNQGKLTYETAKKSSRLLGFKVLSRTSRWAWWTNQKGI